MLRTECPLAFLWQILLQSVLFWDWCSASSRGSSEMLLIWSFHLSGGRPRGLAVVKSYLYAWYGCREWGILATCPNQVNCRLLISWVMVLSIWSSRLMLTFLILSLSVTPAMVLRHRISNTSSLFLSIFRSVQDSELYVAIGKIRVL